MADFFKRLATYQTNGGDATKFRWDIRHAPKKDCSVKEISALQRQGKPDLYKVAKSIYDKMITLILLAKYVSTKIVLFHTYRRNLFDCRIFIAYMWNDIFFVM